MCGACLGVRCRLYIFGGKGADGAVFNDMWCLDVERWAWSQLPSTTAPPPARCVTIIITSIRIRVAVVVAAVLCTPWCFPQPAPECEDVY